MNLVTGDTSYPPTEDVMSLYEDVESAYAQEHLSESGRVTMLEAAASAETHEDISRVRRQLEEYTNHALE